MKYYVNFGFGSKNNRVVKEFETKSEAKKYIKEKLKSRTNIKWFRNPRIIEVRQIQTKSWTPSKAEEKELMAEIKYEREREVERDDREYEESR